MSKIFLIEDHNEALGIWRKKRIKNLDLVHIDAHIDFGFHPAKPIKKIVNEARSLKELKKDLEYSLNFTHYEKDFDKQSNIGNYIYPAMEEGMVKNFYWVVPGAMKEFKEPAKSIKDILRGLAKQTRQAGWPKQKAPDVKNGLIRTQLFGRDFIVCILARLPALKQKILLDIDVDFLTTETLINAANTAKIGKRKPWILPQDLVRILKKRIKNPQAITISYSVNGGWIPIKYKHLGDEIAYCFSPDKFKARFEHNLQAAKNFEHFASCGKKEYYRKATNLNSTYRVEDNNYGPLYLSLHKLCLAEKEFLKILRVDKRNPACLLGLGNIALERRDYKGAKRYFSSVCNSKNNRLFGKVKNQSLLGLAKAEFELGNSKRAKRLLFCYQTHQPLQPQSYYLLGQIFEKEKHFERSARLYKDAIRLGLSGIEPIWRLLKISYHLEEKDANAIIRYINVKYKEFKKGFIRAKGLSLKKGKKLKGLHKVEGKMAAFEKRLEKIKEREG